ncbi:MAG: biotin/lipoyl-containing protein [Chloroflexota bacterium]|nr:biotin/lipoyl-containing protein [Chloroflexota bacterium]
MSQGQLRQKSPPSDQVFHYRVESQGETVRVNLGGNEIELAVTAQGDQEGWFRTADGSLHSFVWAWAGSSLELWLDGTVFVFERVERRRQGERESSVGGADIVALMPGTVEQILVQPGDPVERGQTVIIMESMKMELSVAAHRDGVVKQIPVGLGQQVDKGMRLLELEEQ